MSTPKIIAHRGLATRATENTIEAFRHAVEIGIEGVELDVRRTADGEIVVHHDATVGRLSIRRSRHAEVVAAGRDLGYEIPLLSDVLEEIADVVHVDVELKEHGYEHDVLDVVTASATRDRVTITTFHVESVGRLRALDPGVSLGLLVGSARHAFGALTHSGQVASARRAKSRGATVLAPHWRLIRAGALTAAHDVGLPVWVWTVNAPSILRRLLADPRVGAVITDDPALAMRLRDDQPSAT